MLTIKAPVELQCKTSMGLSYEYFGERIRGNYHMIDSGITGEDLLHVTTAPPVYFFEEGGMTNLVDQTNVRVKQENKLEVVNQLINRILVSGSADFTYQDKVYITNILNKLGIRNEQHFMKQVQQLIEETDNTARLVNLYWQNMTELRRMVKGYQNTVQNQEYQTEALTEQYPLYLHQEIMNRLQTGAIWQEIQNFQNSGNIHNTYISSNELQLSEQKRITQNILLNRLENEVRGEKNPLIYRHENYYEEAVLPQEAPTEQQVTEHLAAAVLLQLVDNVYQTRYEQQDSHTSKWYHLENAVYQTAENTLQRMQSSLTQNLYRTHEAGSYTTNINRQHRQEITMINRLLQSELFTDQQQENTLLTQEYHTENSQLRKNILQQTDASIRIQEGGQTSLTQHYVEETQTVNPEENLELLEQQLHQINRVNLENRNKYIQMLQQMQEGEQKRENRTEVTRRMRQESLQALENPEKLLLAYREEAQQQQQEKQASVKEAMELLSPETKQIYQVLEQYMKMPQQMRESGIIAGNPVGQLLSDITEIKNDRKTKELHYIRQQGAEQSTPESAMHQVSDTVMPEQEAGYGRIPEPAAGGPLIFREENFFENNRIQDNGRPAGTSADAAVQRPEYLLQQDIAQIEHDRQQQELIYAQMPETLREVSQTVIERWQEREAAEGKQSIPAGVQAAGNASLVHRTAENHVDEEVLEQLMQQNRLLKNETRTTEKVVESSNTVNTSLHQQTNQKILQETEDITELVRRGMQKQLGTISEQVYSRLERRLQNERKRRGY